MDEDYYDADQLLIVFTQGRNVACPQCHYNLRNLSSPVCPECGVALTLNVNSAMPKQKLFMTGLLGLAAGAGMNGMLLVYLTVLTLRGILRGESSLWIFFTFGCVLFSCMISIWFERGQSFRRKSVAVRVTLAAGCWLLPVTNVVFFAYLFR